MERRIVALFTPALVSCGLVLFAVCAVNLSARDNIVGWPRKTLFTGDQLELTDDVNRTSVKLDGATPITTLSENPFDNSTCHWDNDTQGANAEGLPQCYSSSEADPSEGSWRSCLGGVKDSPVDMAQWDHPPEFQRLYGCQKKWGKAHKDGLRQPYWAWQPSSCSLDYVTKPKFCRIMEGRKGLLLVGDSLTRLMTATIASIVRATFVSERSKRLVHDEWRACDGKLAIRFIRNDYLDCQSTPFRKGRCRDATTGKPAYHSQCEIFASDSILENFDTLVVNSGAHPRSPEDYGPAMEEASSRLMASMRRLHGDSAITVARTTVTGHWNCTTRMFDGPVYRNDATALVTGAPSKYNWSSLPTFNALLEEAFTTDDGWILLDAFTPTLLRPDLHIGGKDCLHYCLPGPSIHWVTLLYNILLVAVGDPADPTNMN